MKDLNISKTKEMLQKHLEYSKVHDMENILSWEPPASFLAEYHYNITGVSRDGLPVIILPWGQWDLRKIAESGQKETWLKYMDQMLAKLDAKIREVGAHQAVVISDWGGYSMRQATSMGAGQLLVEVGKRTDANYPLIYKQIWVINSKKI
jgi:hypothetical protein